MVHFVGTVQVRDQRAVSLSTLTHQTRTVAVVIRVTAIRTIGTKDEAREIGIRELIRMKKEALSSNFKFINEIRCNKLFKLFLAIFFHYLEIKTGS